MGLDMYLEAEKFVDGYEHHNDGEKYLYRSIIKSVGLEQFTNKIAPFVTVAVTVAYWRKASAIHNWFVQHLMNNVDECQRMYVSRGNIIELLEQARRALSAYKNNDFNKVKEILSPISGCFFGNTEIDDNYVNDLKDTIKMLTPWENEELHKKFTLYYRASW